VIAAFVPAVDNGFVNYDDRKNFLENGSFRGVGRPQVVWAFTTSHLGVYQPLSWLILEAEYASWGLDPRGYHVVSLVIYVLTVLALYALTVAVVARCRPGLERDDPGALRAGTCLAVGLYAVHPLRVEAVAWVSCQPYLPCALFSVLTVLAYLRAHGDPQRVGRGWLAGSLVLFAAALLSKAAAVSLPIVLFVLDVYPLRRLGPGRWRGPEARRAYGEKVPFVLLSAVFTALAAWARARAMSQVPGYGLEERAARACYGVWFYLLKTVAPVRISACYPLPLRISLTEPRFLVSALGVVAATALLVALRRRLPGVLAAWAAYLALLVPSAGLVPTGGQYLAADRYSLLPTMALAVLAAAALGEGLRRGGVMRGALLAAGIVAGLALVVQSRALCRTWHNSVALWSHAVAASTGPNPFADFNLGLVLAEQPGKLSQARAWMDEAVRVGPNDPDLHSGLTIILARQGKIDEALAHTREALRLDPRNVAARVNLGNLLAIKGDTAGAIAAYEQALRLDPGSADAHGNLGVVLAGRGRAAEAEAHLLDALRLNPNMALARRALDDLRRRPGR
jgi:tetratricopeptide (TPR) repeat protein